MAVNIGSVPGAVPPNKADGPEPAVTTRCAERTLGQMRAQELPRGAQVGAQPAGPRAELPASRDATPLLPNAPSPLPVRSVLPQASTRQHASWSGAEGP